MTQPAADAAVGLLPHPARGAWARLAVLVLLAWALCLGWPSPSDAADAASRPAGSLSNPGTANANAANTSAANTSPANNGNGNAPATRAPPTSETLDAALDRMRDRLTALQKSLQSPQSDDTLLALRNTAQATRDEAAEASALLQPQLASVQARLAELGPRAAAEAPDIAALRAALERGRTTLDSQARIARLLTLESEQAADQVVSLRRAQFQVDLSTRTASILSATFWTELQRTVGPEMRRLSALGRELGAAFAAAPAGALVALLASLLALGALQWLATRAIWSVATTHIKPGRLRRSFVAAASVLLWVLTAGLAGVAIALVADWTGQLSPETRALLATAVGVLCFSSYLAGLGRVLLSAKRPSWRLLAIPDPVALGMRRSPLVLGVLVFVGWLAERLPARVNASVETLVALDCIVSLAIGMAIFMAQLRASRLLRQMVPDAAAPGHQAVPQAAETAQDKPPTGQTTDQPANRPTNRPTIQPAHLQPRPAWAAVLDGILWLALAISVVCLLSGYVALGSLIVKQIIWVATIAGSAYLAALLIDDLCSGPLATPRGEAPVDTLSGDALRRAQVRDQVAVVLSAAGRVLVVLIALVLIVAPFGEGPIDLFRRGSALGSGLTIGEAQIRPLALLQALLVLVFGLAGVSLLKRWLTERYLPTTQLEPGMRTSTVTMISTASAVVVAALALSASGFGLERVAWLASALSVGIGFGLQGVVQNFVSGLILLAERPVKVGDLVSLGGVEGDIRRINVRATEIQLGDRSTVIVPNSEFITKTVRNVTHGNPLGLVQIKLPMPLDTDVDAVRAVLLAALQRHEQVLDTPAPAVELDGIVGNTLVFNATGLVNSPRMVYGVRSALLFDVLRALRQADLPMSSPTTLVLPAAGPATPGDPGIQASAKPGA